MTQTKAGAKVARQNMIAKYGSEDKYKEFMSTIGKAGGQAGRGHAFAHGKLDPSKTGKLGGRGNKSKRAEG